VSGHQGPPQFPLDPITPVSFATFGRKFDTVGGMFVLVRATHGRRSNNAIISPPYRTNRTPRDLNAISAFPDACPPVAKNTKTAVVRVPIRRESSTIPTYKPVRSDRRSVRSLGYDVARMVLSGAARFSWGNVLIAVQRRVITIRQGRGGELDFFGRHTVYPPWPHTITAADVIIIIIIIIVAR